MASRIGVTREALAGARLTLKSNIARGDMLVIDGGLELIDEVTLLLDEDGKINGDTGVELLADDPALGLENTLQWRVSISGAKSQGFSRSVASWWIDAGADGATVSLDEQPKAVGQTAGGSRGLRGFGVDDVQIIGTDLVSYVQGNEVGRADIGALLFEPFPAATVIAYDADGNVESVTEDGAVTTYTYNADGTVDTDTRGAVSRQYTYDGDGNLTGIEEI